MRVTKCVLINGCSRHSRLDIWLLLLNTIQNMSILKSLINDVSANTFIARFGQQAASCLFIQLHVHRDYIMPLTATCCVLS